MHIPDLEQVNYFDREDCLAVGWLSGDVPFTSGTVPDGFTERLWQFCRIQVMMLLGVHECDICPPLPPPQAFDTTVIRDGEKLFLGSGEIRVLGQNGQAYAAPNLIYHYVTVHAYLPPQPFIDAVLFGPSPSSSEYQNYLRMYWPDALL